MTWYACVIKTQFITSRFCVYCVHKIIIFCFKISCYKGMSTIGTHVNFMFVDQCLCSASGGRITEHNKQSGWDHLIPGQCSPH